MAPRPITYSPSNLGRNLGPVGAGNHVGVRLHDDAAPTAGSAQGAHNIRATTLGHLILIVRYSRVVEDRVRGLRSSARRPRSLSSPSCRPGLRPSLPVCSRRWCPSASPGLVGTGVNGGGDLLGGDFTHMAHSDLDCVGPEARSARESGRKPDLREVCDGGTSAGQMTCAPSAESARTCARARTPARAKAFSIAAPTSSPAALTKAAMVGPEPETGAVGSGGERG